MQRRTASGPEAEPLCLRVCASCHRVTKAAGVQGGVCIGRGNSTEPPLQPHCKQRQDAECESDWESAVSWNECGSNSPLEMSSTSVSVPAADLERIPPLSRGFNKGNLSCNFLNFRHFGTLKVSRGEGLVFICSSNALKNKILRLIFLST